MTLEDVLAEINRDFFLHEFSYARNQFVPEAGPEVEFADHVVWVKDVLLLFQLKERAEQQATSAEDERRWFKNKILNKAKKQVKDTLAYLRQCPEIRIVNQKGHANDVKVSTAKPVSIVIYSADRCLPEDCLMTKGYRSSEVGFIHIFPVHDYLGVCQSLVTLAEIAEYLQYRERVLTQWGQSAANLSEPVLVGHFIGGDVDACPVEADMRFLHLAHAGAAEFDLLSVLRDFESKIYHRSDNDSGARDYYKIVAELLVLNRVGLRNVKQRMELCASACREDKLIKPYRAVIPETGCAFVFIPLTARDMPNRWKLLHNFTLAAKYDLRAARMIGISFLKDGENLIVDWSLAEFPWEPNAEMDKLLKEADVFRPMKAVVQERYLSPA
jgi:hypothetical protein